jgi:hypothetical protein
MCCSFVLKKAIPFALTLVLGSFIGGLFKSVGVGGQKTEPTRAYFDAYGDGHRHSCRMRYRGRDLVAETKPLNIINVPDARWPRGLEAEKRDFERVRVMVTFDADGKVSAATPEGGCFSDGAVARLQPVRDAVERAALMIQFEPETVNSVPVTVTREVEIRFMEGER